MTITAPQRGVAVFESAMAPVEPILLATSPVTLGWQWYLLAEGMEPEAGLSRRAAAVAVGIPLGLFALVGLA